MRWFNLVLSVPTKRTQSLEEYHHTQICSVYVGFLSFRVVEFNMVTLIGVSLS